MTATIIWLIISLAVILYGANLLVDGSSALAKRMGLSDLVIGLTVVALGTSAPELAVSIASAASGATTLAVGSAVGSNTVNILVIIGITAIVRPIPVHRSVMIDQMPIMVLTALLLVMLGNTAFLDAVPASIITRSSGIFLLLLSALFVAYTVMSAKKQKSADDLDAGVSTTGMPVFRAVLYVAGGLAGLIWGGDKFVDAASSLAISLGMTESAVGLTIVAVGTSVPELATSVMAALKGRPGIAVGNVVGSNIFNSTLILGASATVRPLMFGAIGNIDLAVMTVSALLFWLLAKVWGKRIINRAEGAIMLIVYIAYATWLLRAA